MSTHHSVAWVASLALVGGAAAPVAAQSAASGPNSGQRQTRYQVGVMERVLERAVEHGVTMVRDRLQAIAPTEMMMLDTAHVRGFRLDGYGVFFDAVAPSFGVEQTLLWSLRTLDQNNLGLESALDKLKSHIAQLNDTDLQQAFRRLELQVAPMTAVARVAQLQAKVGVAGARNESGSAAAVTETVPAARAGADAASVAGDAILADPNEAYRTEVVRSLEDAMLDYSGALSIEPDEWFTVAVRRNDERARLGPGDSDAQTFVIRVKGADLNAFHAHQISREEALKRIDLRVF